MNVVLNWNQDKKNPSMNELKNYFLQQIDEQLEIDKRDVMFLLYKEGTKYEYERFHPFVEKEKPNEKVYIIDGLKYTDDYMSHYKNKKPAVIMIFNDDCSDYKALRNDEEIEDFAAYFKKNKMKRAWETACKFLETNK